MGSWEPDREPDEELEGRGQPGTRTCPRLHGNRLQPGPSGWHPLTEHRGSCHHHPVLIPTPTVGGLPGQPQGQPEVCTVE